MTNAQMQKESLTRAVSGQSWANYPAIIEGFMERGIPESEIIPRVNVFTFNAWKAQGRYVRKGEKGVKVITWIPIPEKRDSETGEVIKKAGKRCKVAYVFHVSQTEGKE